MIEETVTAGRKKCAASQAAGPKGVVVIDVIDHELPQFDG
jgi:hypothetical protein